MQPFYEDFLGLLEERHNEILGALEGLLPAALDWSPGKGMNSISVMVFHLTGAERYWIGDVVAGEPSGRDRAAEFKVHEVGVDVLKKRLKDNITYARKVLDKLTLQDLETELTSPRDGQKETVAWALIHALEHTTNHLGHIQLTRQLWDLSKSKL